LIGDFAFYKSIFAKSFPINIELSLQNNPNVVNLNEYSDAVEMTEKFSFSFENSGCMINGLVSTRKIIPVFENPVTLAEIMDETENLSDYFLTSKQIEKFKYLKNSKRIDRIKPNGKSYVYTEGALSFPDRLDLPGRTMLTTEAGTNRCSHVIKDRTSGKLRFITPIEAERMQSFPDN